MKKSVIFISAVLILGVLSSCGKKPIAADFVRTTDADELVCLTVIEKKKACVHFAQNFNKK